MKKEHKAEKKGGLEKFIADPVIASWQINGFCDTFRNKPFFDTKQEDGLEASWITRRTGMFESL